MWPRDVEYAEDFFINTSWYTWSQDDQQLIDESLEGGTRDRSLFDNVVNQTHVGRYAKRDVNVSSAWSYDATDSFAYWCTAFASPSKDVKPRLVNVHFLTNRGDGGERLLYSFSCSSLMKACMSSVSLMLRAPPSGKLCTRPSANQTRIMLRAV